MPVRAEKSGLQVIGGLEQPTFPVASYALRKSSEVEVNNAVRDGRRRVIATSGARELDANRRARLGSPGAVLNAQRVEHEHPDTRADVDESCDATTRQRSRTSRVRGPQGRAVLGRPGAACVPGPSKVYRFPSPVSPT